MQNNLGELLKKLRLEKHFTQTQVADKLGITRQAYAYYEKCNAIPDLTILMKLAALYNISVRLFLDYYPLEEASQIAENGNYHITPQQQTLYPEYLAFYSEHDNMKKYHHLSLSEKKLLFLFQKLQSSEQLELLNWAYYKSTFHPDTIFLSELTKK